jgi:hypothetical protein
MIEFESRFNELNYIYILSEYYRNINNIQVIVHNLNKMWGSNFNINGFYINNIKIIYEEKNNIKIELELISSYQNKEYDKIFSLKTLSDLVMIHNLSKL